MKEGSYKSIPDTTTLKAGSVSASACVSAPALGVLASPRRLLFIVPWLAVITFGLTVLLPCFCYFFLTRCCATTPCAIR